jgi:hypothetical protein
MRLIHSENSPQRKGTQPGVRTAWTYVERSRHATRPREAAASLATEAPISLRTRLAMASCCCCTASHEMSRAAAKLPQLLFASNHEQTQCRSVAIDGRPALLQQINCPRSSAKFLDHGLRHSRPRRCPTIHKLRDSLTTNDWHFHFRKRAPEYYPGIIWVLTIYQASIAWVSTKHQSKICELSSAGCKFLNSSSMKSVRSLHARWMLVCGTCACLSRLCTRSVAVRIFWRFEEMIGV